MVSYRWDTETGRWCVDNRHAAASRKSMRKRREGGHDTRRTFPVEPLVEYIERLGPLTTVLEPWPTLLRTIGRAKQRGGPILESTADHAACALSVHPSAIWPEWFE